MSESGFGCKAFVGVRFALVGFNPIDENTVRSKLVSGGGVDVGQYSQICTHFIVYNLAFDDPICVAARSSGKVVVTGSWVHHSFDLGVPVVANSVLYMPPIDLDGIPASKSLVVCLTGYHRQDREDIMTMVGLMGAQFSKQLVSTLVTHIICYKFEGEKYETAKSIKRIKIVNHRWLEDCLKSWKLLPEADYKISGFELEMMDNKEQHVSVKHANTSPLSAGGNDIPAVQTNSDGSSKDNWQTPDRHLEAMVSTYAVSSQHHRASTSHELRPRSPKENLRPAPSINGPTESLDKSLEDDKLWLSYAQNVITECLRDEMLERSSTEPILLQEPRSSASPKQNSDHIEGREVAVELVVPMEADIWTPTNMTLKERSVTEPLMRRSSTSPGLGSIERKDQLEREFPKKKTVSRKSLGTTGMKNNPMNQKGSLYLSKHTPKDERIDCLSKGEVSVPVTDNGNQKEISSPVQNTEAVPEMAKHIDSETEACKKIDSSYAPEEKDNLVLDLIVNQDKLQAKTSEVADAEVEITTKDPSDGTLQLEVGEKKSKRKRKKESSSAEVGKSSVKKKKKSRKEHDAKANDTLMKDIGENPAEEENLALVSSGGDQSPVAGETFARTEAVTKDPTDAAVQLEADKNKGKRRKETTGGKTRLQSGKKASSSTVEFAKPCAPEEEDHLVLDLIVNQDKLKAKTSEKADAGVEITTKDPSDGALQLEENLALENKSGKISSVGDQSPFARKVPSDAAVVGKSRKEAIMGKNKLQSEKKASSSRIEDDAKASNSMMKDIEINSAEVKENVAVDKNSGDVSSNGAQIPVAGKPLARKEVAAKDPSHSTMQSEVDKKKRKHVKEATVERSSLQSGKKESSSTVKTGKSGAKKTKKSKKEHGAEATDTVIKDIGDHAAEEKENITVNNKSGKASSRGDQSPVSGVKKTKKSKKEHGAKATNTVIKDIGHNSAEGKENIAVNNKSGGDESPVSGKPLAKKKAAKGVKESEQLSSNPMACRKVIQDQEEEPKCFILSGHRTQRKEYQQIIKSLNGKCCKDSHQWSYQATHFIAPEIRRTEKFFAAAASGSWILKTDYVPDSEEAGKLLPEEPYEWHSNSLSEYGVINLESPRKWRLIREQTGHGALYGMRIVVYGDCTIPALDTLKRAVKAGDGTILATAPPYTRFLNQNIDFALISLGTPCADFWVQEFIRHEIPCVLSDYLVDYVCKSGYALDKHVLYNTNSWAEKSFNKLQLSAREKVFAEEEEEEDDDDIACEVCGSRERGEVMLICGDEEGLRGCGVGTHIDCCDPPLSHVPEDDWFCSRCNAMQSFLLIRERRVNA